MTEQQRKGFNAERLLRVDESIRKEVRAVLGTLEHYGFFPIIGQEVWRDPATQIRLYREGLTKVKWGFHCATRGGKPASLAADIFDSKRVQNPSLRFICTIGYAARAQGLGWGGYFDLPKRLKVGLDTALDGIPKGSAPPAGIKYGWDSPHVQTKRVTVAQAKRGER